MGVQMSDNIKWEDQITANLKKARKRLYFLRQLKSFQVGADLMATFYRSTIESCLTNYILTWYASATKKDKDKLAKVVRTASYIIGVEMDKLDGIYIKRTLKRTKSILKDDYHPLNDFLVPLPSGKRLRSIWSGTERMANSFVLSAIRLYNKQK